MSSYIIFDGFICNYNVAINMHKSKYRKHQTDNYNLFKKSTIKSLPLINTIVII